MSVDKSIDLVSEKFLEHDDRDGLDIEEENQAGQTDEAADGLDSFHKDHINEKFKSGKMTAKLVLKFPPKLHLLSVLTLPKH